MESVYCIDCEFVEPHSRKQSTYAWLCRQFKRQPRGAIAPRVLDVDAPFERCIDVNKFNNCREFAPNKETKDVASET